MLNGYAEHHWQGSQLTLPYRLYSPREAVGHAATAAKRWPLVLFLHGAGERGDDNTATLIHGAAEMSSPDLQSRYPAFIAIPQCPADDVWASLDRTHEPTVLADQPTPALGAVLELVHHLKVALPIDPARVYLTGLSIGGYGTWDLLMRCPAEFAAAVPICGGGDCRSALIEPLVNLPLWVFHGAHDAIVPPERSREVVGALQSLGGRVRYTEYANAEHDSWTETYANPQVWDWLFAQSR